MPGLKRAGRFIVWHFVTYFTVCAADWPGWRGPDGVGLTAEDAPLQWSKTSNVRWRTPLPEPGNSTPVVSGNRIFVTQPVKTGGRRILMCFDRLSGKLLWQAGVASTADEPTHASNPYASASPATDGKIVVAWFGSAGLAAYDFEGKELWKRDLGRQRHTWGYASSPVLHGDRVFLNFGPGTRSFVIALDKNSGKTLWQYDPPAGKGTAFADWQPEDMYGSWATPIVIRTETGSGSREELVLSLPRRVVALDPASGKTLWFCEGLGDLVYPSPVFGEGVVVAMAGFGGASLAVRAGGNGDVTGTHRLWHKDRSRQTIGSGVIHEGIFYSVDQNGIADASELKTGATIWTNRLTAGGDSDTVWSSLVLSGGRIYVMNQSGATFVFKPGRQFESVATNRIEETTNSSVVISGGEVILRTHSALWSIGEP